MTVSALVVNAVLAEFEGGGTIVRTRGRFMVEPATAAQDAVINLGLAVVDERAFAAGAASVPLATDLEDLFWFTSMNLGIFGTTAGNGPQSQTVEVDVKAMRKFDSTDTIVLVATGGGSGHTASLYGYADFLLMRGSSS